MTHCKFSFYKAGDSINHDSNKCGPLHGTSYDGLNMPKIANGSTSW